MRDFKISFFPIIGDSKFRVPTETGKPGMKIVMEHEKLVKSHGFLPILPLDPHYRGQ